MSRVAEAATVPAQAIGKASCRSCGSTPERHLQRLPVLHHGLDAFGLHGTGESLQGCLASLDHRDGQRFSSMYMGTGGTSPFMGMLGEQFPEAQFLITGLLGPKR